MIGIYKIENLINHHIYIGQSIDIEDRWKKEKQNAFCSTSKSYQYPLSRAFRKYGIDNFSFEVIEECEMEQLNSRERYWVAYYNSFFEGYNQTPGGDSPVNNRPKEVILSIIHDLETTDLYHREIAEKWKVSTELVQGINTGRYWFFENKTYPLQTRHKGKSRHYDIDTKICEVAKNYCIKCGKEISRQAQYCVECYGKIQRKVERPNKEDLYQYLVSIQGNFSQASRKYGVTDNAIRKWCKSYGIPHSSKEYKNI